MRIAPVTHAEPISSTGNSTVHISRHYFSSRTNGLAEAVTHIRWNAMLLKLQKLEPISMTIVVDGSGERVDVVTDELRGRRGAYAVHDLGVRHGAFAHID